MKGALPQRHQKTKNVILVFVFFYLPPGALRAVQRPWSSPKVHLEASSLYPKEDLGKKETIQAVT